MNFDPNDLKKRRLIFNGRHLPYNPDLKKRAKFFRENLTPTEKKFWLNFCKLDKYKWRTQTVIDNYIVDFYCPKLKMIIELDGLEHYKKYNKEYDAVRDDILKGYGLTIIRIVNKTVNDDFGKCIAFIQEEIVDRMLNLNQTKNDM